VNSIEIESLALQHYTYSYNVISVPKSCYMLPDNEINHD